MCNERLRPRIYQTVYNAITRNIEDELIPCCRRYKIDIVIFNPVAGGFFSGKYRSTELPSDDRFSNQHLQLGQMYRDRYFKSSVFSALSFLEPLVTKHGLMLVAVVCASLGAAGDGWE
ncbi:hypothetical protein N8T08_002025 [Aspergillus melleus]|uniref:Uncharacterized protein n=1 Tax=Aspergillus melleus TaxID=138277 RepID=A0ACC3AN43_9EURO|nr:hypothetical protein N8T08_002025 [Aspergillus melleus]